MQHTLEEVRAAVAAACERYPNRKNPVMHSLATCVYTGARGAHCIAGQVLVDLGHEDVVPAADDEDNILDIGRMLGNRDATGLFTDEAIGFLECAQNLFDNAGHWSRAYKKLDAAWIDWKGNEE